MKKPQLFWLVLLCTCLGGFAQKLPKEKRYDLNTISNTINVTPSQKKELAIALEQRKKQLSKALESKNKQNSEKTYQLQFEQILNEKQQHKFYDALIDPVKLKQTVEKEYSRLLKELPVPKVYQKVLKYKLRRYSYQKAFSYQRYNRQSRLRERKQKELRIQWNQWVGKQRKVLRLSKSFLKKNSTNATALSLVEKQSIFTYQFYALVKEQHARDLEFVDTVLQELLAKEKIKKIAKKMLSAKIVAIVAGHENLGKLDTKSRKKLGKVLLDSQLKKIMKAFEEKKPIVFEKINLSPAVKTGREFALIEKQQQKVKLLKMKIKKAKLGKKRGTQLLALVVEKDKAIATARKNKSTAKNLSNLIGTGKDNSPRKIEMAYQKSLAELLSKKEFATIFGDKYDNGISEKIREQIKSLKANITLTKEQEKEIVALMLSYYLNESVTNDYYSYDKRTAKKKNALARYRFQKKYSELMKGFGIEVSSTRAVNNRTFQWN